MHKLALFCFFLSNMAFAADNVGTLTCGLAYQVPVAPGQVKYIAPKNSFASVSLLNIKFCNDKGCEMKRVGSAFLGSGIGGASVRIVGDRSTIVLRDANGNRSAFSFNAEGLVPLDDGGALFTLNIDGVYEGEPISGLLLNCGLNP